MPEVGRFRKAGFGSLLARKSADLSETCLRALLGSFGDGEEDVAGEAGDAGDAGEAGEAEGGLYKGACIMVVSSRVVIGHDYRCWTTRAGTPTTRVFGGTSLVTRLQAATTDPRPIVTPFVIMHLLPSHTLSSITIGSASMFHE